MLSQLRLSINSVCPSAFIIMFILSIGFNIRLYFKELATVVVSSQNSQLPPSLYQEILYNTRTEIQHQLSWYNFSLSGARGLEDLLMDSGGTPLQNIIISTWKSGSTLLGQLLNSVPGTYYHFEPLISYGIRRIRSFPEANRTLTTVQNLLECNYEGLKDYVDYGRKNFDYFSRNKRLWALCKVNKLLCDDATFMSRFCKLFPFQAMKIVRLRLQLMPKILNNTELNVRVILLVRDPRGVMQSWHHRDFCNYETPGCLTASVICADMVSDYEAAGQILELYPGRLMVLRYEDLVMKPKVISHQILKFLKFSDILIGSLHQLLKWHTKFRVLRGKRYKWQKISNFSDVNDIQMACKKAMLQWGYRMAHNESHLRSKGFNPTADISTLNWSRPVNRSDTF